MSMIPLPICSPASATRRSPAMLTRIRNAQIARHDSVVIPASNIKKSIAKILLEEGYIKSVENVADGLQGGIKIGTTTFKPVISVRRIVN